MEIKSSFRTQALNDTPPILNAHDLKPFGLCLTSDSGQYKKPIKTEEEKSVSVY